VWCSKRRAATTGPAVSTRSTFIANGREVNVERTPPPAQNLLPDTAKLNDFKRVAKTWRRPNKIPSSSFFIYDDHKFYLYFIYDGQELCYPGLWTRKEPMLPHAVHGSTPARIPIVCSTPFSHPAARGSTPTFNRSTSGLATLSARQAASLNTSTSRGAPFSRC
jgi:hypothetical protein